MTARVAGSRGGEAGEAAPPRFPPARVDPFHPPALLAALRSRAPVAPVTLPDGSCAWLVTGHAEARAVLTDRRFSADATRPGYPAVQDRKRVYLRERPSISRMDDPRHGALRRMLAPAFLPRAMARLRPGVEALVEAQVDHLLGRRRPADLVADFALPIPALVICGLLGVPAADRAFFHDRAQVLNQRGSTTAEARAADTELFDYFERFVAEQARDPGDGLVGQLVREQLRPGALDRDELVNLARTLLVAGHLSTSSMLALSICCLLARPEGERLRPLVAGPEAVAAAVEELLRFHTVVQDGLARVATEDVAVGGVTVRAGEGVVVSLAGANRDGTAFADPDRLDLGRDARGHLAFGHGAHQCVGRPLARLELGVALAALARRIPTLRLAVPIDQLPFRKEMHIYGLDALPVTW